MTSKETVPRRDSLAYLRQRISLHTANRNQENPASCAVGDSSPDSSSKRLLNIHPLSESPSTDTSGGGSVRTKHPSREEYPCKPIHSDTLSFAGGKENKFMKKSVSASKLPASETSAKKLTVAEHLKRTTKSYSQLPALIPQQNETAIENENEKPFASQSFKFRKARDSALFTRQRLIKKPILPNLVDILELPIRPASEVGLNNRSSEIDSTRDVITEPQTAEERSRSHSRERSGLTSKSSMSLCSSKEDVVDIELPKAVHENVRPSPIKMEPVYEKGASPPPRPRSAANTGYGESGYMSASTSALPCPVLTPARSMPALASVPETQPVEVKCTSSKCQSIQVNRKDYQVLHLMGTGGSSKVYLAFDQSTNSCVAIKCVDLCDAEPAVRRAYENEIKLLSKLQHSDKVVKLYDFELVGDSLYVVMEKGETDLAGFLKARKSEIMSDPLMIKFYWAEMLKATQVVHEQGVVHSDLKPSNFLLVNGNLKLIDFGIASAVPSNKTAVTRECPMGTINYMSPETQKYIRIKNILISFPITTKSDVWSLGCILYSMAHGRTPFSHISNACTKMFAIMDEAHTITFKEGLDPLLVDTLKLCLNRNPIHRPSVEQLLKHTYLDKNQGNVNSSNCAKSSHLKISEKDILHALNLNSPNTRERIAKQILGPNN